MTVKIYQVDAFTDQPFKGNPAAVCPLEAPAQEGWMQDVAREMNLSETAFLYQEAGHFNLRWFTPMVEVALCGHATLASAHILWETGVVAPGQAMAFETLSGRLAARLLDDLIELDFPATPAVPADPPPGLLEALGAKALFVGQSRYDFLVELANEQAVRALQPNFSALKHLDARGIMVTSRASTRGYDFISRFFAPAAGIDEDPVTGSAHCCLGPYWQERLGKSTFQAYQASLRGGTLAVRVNSERVHLGGRAVTVLAGELQC